jgi:hypothetical protein
MADIARKGDQEVKIVDHIKQIPVNTVTDGSIERLAVTAAGEIDTIDVPRPGTSFVKFLENAGSRDLNINGSGTPVTFTVSPPSGKIWYIYTVSLLIEDSSINFSKFGGLAALTNGLDLKVKEGGEVERLLENFKRNGDFYLFANRIELQSASTDMLQMSFTVRESTGTVYQLTNSLSESLKAIVNDNLTGLDRFNILIRGYEVDE